jgi:hypothetical protein
MNNNSYKYWYDYFIVFIIIVKIIFLILLLYSFYLKIKQDTDKYEKINEWKEKTEFIFIISMSIILIYLFNPRKNSLVIDGHVKFLLFAYGFIILLNAPWSLFISKTLVYEFIKRHFLKNS